MSGYGVSTTSETVTSITGPLPAGTNVIGHVIADTGSTTAVTALPALPAGSNVIGHVIADTGSTTAVTALPATPAGENHIGALGGTVARVQVTFVRPADTNVYASGDLVANSVTAGSVVPLSFAISRATGKGGMIRRLRFRKTGTSITNASFRVHLYSVSPTVSNGDNGVWLTDTAANYVGSLDVTCDKAFTDGAAGNGVPNTGSEIIFTADTYFALVEARAAYTPTSGETIAVELELIQN